MKECFDASYHKSLKTVKLKIIITLYHVVLLRITLILTFSKVTIKTNKIFNTNPNQMKSEY
jgi:hypothetical protein